MTCRFEVGKTYVTRDGRKAVIYRIYESQAKKIHGAVETERGWSPREWCHKGFFYSGGVLSGADLVLSPREWDVWLCGDNMTTADMSSYSGFRKLRVREVLDNE